MRFELIEGISTFEGTCYFELVKNSNKTKFCWNENAHYLEMSVFIYWVNVFKKASKNFDYFSFNKLYQKELQELKIELVKFENSLNEIRGVNEFEEFFNNSYENTFFGEDLEEQLQNRVKRLADINQKIIKIIDECLTDKESFWVLGM